MNVQSILQVDFWKIANNSISLRGMEMAAYKAIHVKIGKNRLEIAHKATYS